jgi:plasmid replication initiation protein
MSKNKLLIVAANMSTLTEKQPDNLLVAQSNHLIEATYKMDVRAKRVMLCLLAKLDARKPIPETLHLDVNEYMQWTKTDESLAYRDMKTGTELLLKTIIHTYDAKKRSGTMYVLADSLRYWDGEGRIECSFTRWVKPYIHYLTKNFTEFKLLEATQFKSFYTIRLYEMLMQFKSTGWRKITVEQYRQIMAIEKKQYKAFADLRRWTLEPAIKEINEKTDWVVTYDSIRKGRAIGSLMFKIKMDDQLKLDLE